MDSEETTCPDCAETIKAAAKVCKHCGKRRDADGAVNAVLPSIRQASATEWRKPPTGNAIQIEKTSQATVGITLCVAVALIGLFWFIATRQANIRNMVDPAKQQKAQIFIAGLLRDPSSAQFQNVHTNSECVTGEVNMRNGFGGYDGFREFYYDNRVGKGAIKPDDVAIDLDDRSTLRAHTASTDYLDGWTACIDLKA